MFTRVAERRRHLRIAAAYPAVVRDRRGRALARGRTANISESGVLVIVNLRPLPAVNQEFIIDLTVPAVSAARTRWPATRQVSYRCRAARVQTLGHLAGLGLEFLEKLA